MRRTLTGCMVAAAALASSVGSPVYGTSSSATRDGGWQASEVVTSFVSGTSPTLILGFDNNLEICLALREPRTEDALRGMGIEVTRSQVVLMQLWNLVERTGDGALRCTVPVVELPVSVQIESRAETVAANLVAQLGGAVESFLAAVDVAGWSKHRYTLLGSYVLDGLVWEALEQLGAINSADVSMLDSGSEYWSGVTWITLPPKSNKLGTDSHATDAGTLYAAWTPSALEAMRDLRAPGLREELIAAALGRSDGEPEPTARLRELGLIVDGRAQIPAIAAGSTLCTEGSRLARRVARALVENETVREIERLTGARNESVALIMAYHWIYPAVLSRLEPGGLAPPAVLRGEPGAELAPSLFVVETGLQCLSDPE